MANERAENRPSEHVVCARCGGIRGPRANWPDYCACDEAARPQDPPDSFRHRMEPCHACVLTLHEATTRFAPLYCGRCLQRVQSLNERFGRLVIPISRHSIVNRAAGAKAPAGSIDTTPLDELVEIILAPRDVADHAQAALAHLLDLVVGDGQDVPWRTVVDAARAGGLDEDLLFREFLTVMAVPEATLFSGHSLPAGLWDPEWNADR